MGQVLNKQKMRWLIFSITGLLCIGAGLAIFGEALCYKFNKASYRIWVPWGTASLVVFNAGVCLFGQGIIERINYIKQQEVSRNT